ncbi:MAG: F0F1 ATP synthase subunit gamma, partial [Alistipes sp.]|nr:F0F1 ATP synthase subunit gamma [Alistipes sp.]
MRDIKRRKESIQSTEQITKAMKLVSTVKLQKAKARAEHSKPFFDMMYDTVRAMLAKSGNVNHRFLNAGNSPKKGIIVITANRGLAGGYNSNVIKLITKGDIPKEDVVIYNIGRKGKEAFTRNGYAIAGDYSDVIESPMYSDAMNISETVLKAFTDDEIGEIYLAYT